MKMRSKCTLVRRTPGRALCSRLGCTWLRPPAGTAFSLSGFSFFGLLFLGCQSSVHGTSAMCDRYSHELLFQLVPVGHFLLPFARSPDDPLLRMPSSTLGVVSVFAPVELPLTFLRLIVLCWGLDSTCTHPWTTRSFGQVGLSAVFR